MYLSVLVHKSKLNSVLTKHIHETEHQWGTGRANLQPISRTDSLRDNPVLNSVKGASGEHWISIGLTRC